MTVICDKCGAQIMGGANFCPQCGDPVTEADEAAEPIAADHVSSIVITFGYSSSQNYPKAVELCSQIPQHEVEGEGREAVHEVVLAATDVALAIKLWDIVGNWKSSNMLIDGDAATKSDLVYKGLGCYQDRQRSYRPEQYCFGEREYEFNVWGCKRLNMPITRWGGGWLEFGRLDSDGVWHFDKNRIKQELERSMHEHRYCPVLTPSRVLETLDKIPDTVDPRRDPNWEYDTQPDYVNGTYQDVVVGIRPVLNRAARYVVGNYKPVLAEEREEAEGARRPHHAASEVKISLEVPPEREPRRRRAASPPRASSSGCAGSVLLFITAGLLLACSL